MIFVETAIPGAILIEPELLRDDRGFFARIMDEAEFRSRGLETRFTQWSVSYNARKATLRGMHYQAPPHQEAKLVRCTMGAMYDVILDLRPDSSSYLKWFAVELTAENRRTLYVPEGVAHGFFTLVDGSEVSYNISVGYHAPLQRGVRWNDPAFGIEWPADPQNMSDRDREYPDFTP